MRKPLPLPTASEGCAEKLKVLAEATRLEIVQMLLAGPRRVAELNAVLGIEASLLSHHLRVLRVSGIVCAKRDGREVLYSLHPSIGPGGPRKRGIDFGCCSMTFAPGAERRTR